MASLQANEKCGAPLQEALGGLLLEIKINAYFCQRWTYPSGVGGFGGFGGSFGFGGLILDGRILGDVGFRSGLGVRFQGMVNPPRHYG